MNGGTLAKGEKIDMYVSVFSYVYLIKERDRFVLLTNFSLRKERKKRDRFFLSWFNLIWIPEFPSK
jgi:hypothetical protein